ncbi:DapH/DapD/GlmU-related protein [uncultured Roseibium sp.]|uniref:acyltransferase n=1 Tax=uncultured Roseibium sp. TaxID=1936171 RepID=UPI00260507A1|nr:DapH/DapD/GlmU-related protein [uncultured Roseibium sp.]
MPLQIDPTARISKLADIEDSVRGTVIRIGARTVVDSFVKIKPAGGSGDVDIGENVTLNSGCVIYTGHGLTIGNNVAIAANCTFAPVNHAFEDRDKLIVDQGFQPSRGGITIGDDVWIGANCVFLDGAVVNTGCVIAAGTVVKGIVPAYLVIAGNPWRQVGERS